ncbi:hypothetical protein PR048_016487 [Dryococelus australis]|uniref:Uncharacterized protein n=1 Tax=Dryococelus australis TaxID=614101 RepID=A0ABQ9HK28_9NEOP|nr:hypothetical protein PR048_016487 [Dryococelus australis]
MIEIHQKKLKIPVYHPQDWFQLGRRTGLKTPFQVHEMKHEEFLDFADIFRSGLVVRKNNIDCEKFLWHDDLWLQYRKDLRHLNYKYSHADAPSRQ